MTPTSVPIALACQETHSRTDPLVIQVQAHNVFEVIIRNSQTNLISDIEN
jgi:hypothetical protein